MEKIKEYITKNKKIVIPVVIIIILLLIGGIYFAVQSNSDHSDSKIESTFFMTFVIFTLDDKKSLKLNKGKIGGKRMSFYKNKALKITCIVSLIMICFVYHHYLNTDTKQIKFGATYMTMNNTFYKAVNNEIENVVNNHGDVLYTRDPALDPKKQNEQIKDLVSLGIDVLIINPVESSSINKTLKEVKKAGIKIIVVDAPISDDQLQIVQLFQIIMMQEYSVLKI